MPYIGRWLGFWVTGKLQVYPYDITTIWSRLELTHHYTVAVTPDRGWMILAHQYGLVGRWRPAALSRTKIAEAGWRDPPGGGRLESLDVLTFSWVSGVHIPNTSPRDRGVLLACWEDFASFSGFDCVVVVESRPA